MTYSSNQVKNSETNYLKKKSLIPLVQGFDLKLFKTLCCLDFSFRHKHHVFDGFNITLCALVLVLGLDDISHVKIKSI